MAQDERVAKLTEYDTYYELSVAPIYSLASSTLCHTLSSEIPIFQIGDRGILFTRACTFRLDKSVFQFKGNLVNSRVSDPSMFDYLTELNVRKEIITDRFTNDSGSGILVTSFNRVSGSDLVSVNVGSLGAGSSRPYAGLFELGMRIYITENTYIRMMTSTSFLIARMYNVI